MDTSLECVHRFSTNSGSRTARLLAMRTGTVQDIGPDEQKRLHSAKRRFVWQYGQCLLGKFPCRTCLPKRTTQANKTNPKLSVYSITLKSLPAATFGVLSHSHLEVLFEAFSAQHWNVSIASPQHVCVIDKYLLCCFVQPTQPCWQSLFFAPRFISHLVKTWVEPESKMQDAFWNLWNLFSKDKKAVA